MVGLFNTLDLAKRSLQTQETAIQVTGQNIANVNTTGYSRQTVNITESPDVQTPVGSEGTGTEVAGIDQVVSDLLNSQIQSQNSTSGYWTGQQTALQSAQNGLDEFLNGSGATTGTSSSSASTTDSGLSGQLSALFNAFSALAASPSLSTEQAAVAAGQSVTSSFNQISSQLGSLKSTLNSSLTQNVASANKLLSQIAGLNQQISSTEAGGGTANSLLDQREQDLENLSQLVNISTSTDSSGNLDVSISGQMLVAGRTQLDSLQTYDPGNGNLLVQTATGGADLTLTGGQMQGTIDARDGTLATMQSNLDTLASNLASSVNSIYSAGYNSSGATGGNFFNGTDASDLSVSQSLANDPSTFQLSASATATGDNSVAVNLSNLASTTQSGLNSQTFGNYYGSIVANLGNGLSNANTEVTNQSAVGEMLSQQRSSVSGVSLDEELTNMMTFQQAYEASAQVVTTVNTLMGDTLAMKTS
ncbi:MAG TPA: flagellar hook-associated protein FlgK [Candidatus Sulfotelmatobacter sp.]|nr:flagellar hook-associated protein FlgK [Candidatus Sulfotelmatobacter sp.]